MVTLCGEDLSEKRARRGEHSLIPELLPKGVALFNQQARGRRLPLSEGDLPLESEVGQMKGGMAHPLCVSDLSKQRQTFLTQYFSPLDVAQGTGQAPGSPHSSGTQRRCHSLRSLQRLLQHVPSLMLMFLCIPEP